MHIAAEHRSKIRLYTLILLQCYICGVEPADARVEPAWLIFLLSPSAFYFSSGLSTLRPVPKYLEYVSPNDTPTRAVIPLFLLQPRRQRSILQLGQQLSKIGHWNTRLCYARKPAMPH